MFERYTEKSRRVIFFARYEASQYGSPYIETEHLLLGLLRESPDLTRQLAEKLGWGTAFCTGRGTGKAAKKQTCAETTSSKGRFPAT